METIFGHNPTEEEVRKIVGSMTKEKYLWLISLDKENNDGYRDIAYLYYYRRNMFKVRRYARKIKDMNMVNSFWRTITHP